MCRGRARSLACLHTHLLSAVRAARLPARAGFPAHCNACQSPTSGPRNTQTLYALYGIRTQSFNIVPNTNVDINSIRVSLSSVFILAALGVWHAPVKGTDDRQMYVDVGVGACMQQQGVV